MPRTIHTVTMDLPEDDVAEEILTLLWNILDDNSIGYTECSIEVPG